MLWAFVLVRATSSSTFETRDTVWLPQRRDWVLNSSLIQTGARIIGGLVFLAGVISLVLAPLIGKSVFATLWGVEPLTYIGAVLVIAGLGVTSLSYLITGVMARKSSRDTVGTETAHRWSQITQQYFELFDHDLGRPLRRILGKERELRAVLQSQGPAADSPVGELLDEIERQVPNFRLMMSNIYVLVHLESPDAPGPPQPVEPADVVRKLVDRYTPVAAQSQKEITWWAEPAEFGIVYSDSSAIEHIATNLVDNAVRFATTHVEVKITKNPSHLFVRVWGRWPGNSTALYAAPF